MGYLSVENLSFKYKNAPALVVDGFSMAMDKGEIVALIGDSGSGKSTILRLLTGLEEPAGGQITLDSQILFDPGKKINLEPQKRHIGMIFQDYALFPHLSVLGNIKFAMDKGSRKEKEAKAMELLSLVKLEDHGKKYPHECSGGQQQRIAIARALAADPKLLLLDEPFSNLDARLRASVREEVQGIIRKVGMSAILVTHDAEDVSACADRAIEMAPLCKKSKKSPAL